MAALLAASMALVVAFCLARMLRPSLRDPAHRRDLDAWHALMGVAMAAMLVVTYTRSASVVFLVVFLVGVGWSVVRVSAPGARAAYVRLGLGCTAMVAMLLPAATMSTAAPTAGSAMAHLMPMDHAADRAAGDGQAALAGIAALGPPTALVLALLAAFGVIFAIRLAGTLRGGATVAGRLAACCDVAMAGAMGYLLVGIL